MAERKLADLHARGIRAIVDLTTVDLGRDIGLILDAAAASEVPLPQTAMTQQLMRSAMALGDGQEDYAAIIKTAERAAGVPPLPQDKP